MAEMVQRTPTGQSLRASVNCEEEGKQMREKTPSTPVREEAQSSRAGTLVANSALSLFSEAATPARPGARGADENVSEAACESLRLALTLQSEEERYLEEQRQGAARLAELERQVRVSPGHALSQSRVGGSSVLNEDAGQALSGSGSERGPVDADEGEDAEIDESLALAWRLQQEDDDRALFMALNGGAEPPAGRLPRNVSPSQMTYDQLTELGEHLGKVSKGTTLDVIGALPSFGFEDGSPPNAILGEQCSICRLEFEPDDVLKILPCSHADHAECLAQWLKLNRSCPLCAKEVGPRCDSEQATTQTHSDARCDRSNAQGRADADASHTNPLLSTQDQTDIDTLLNLDGSA